MNLIHHADWPSVAGPADPQLESQVSAILGQLTLDEKIGQMIQPELYQVTPEEAARHKFGSALNGAGMFPNEDRHARPADWVAMTDAFWSAVDAAFADRPFKIPFMWATDAVHGHNNLFGATIFPHNIGLGCVGDPELVGRIGAATAREVAASGIDWTFAPNLTIPRDYRWGRHFEGYAESPALVAAYATAMVEGLQGGLGHEAAPDKVIACAKHWIADGGTRLGIDRGDCHSDEDILRNIHAAGYYAAIKAGVQSVMVSFSGWIHPNNYDHAPERPGRYNGKMAGSRYLITDVLKTRMGFDGLVITDWDAHADVSRCSFEDAGFVINAGVDVLMVSPRPAWKGLCRTLRAQVLDGRIPMARIDDAVTRMLRVKMRAGLWDKPRPAERPITLRDDVIGCAAHRRLANEAARRSAVMLKNNACTLPLRRTARLLVTGSAAQNLQKQTGGWTLSWQGSDLVADDLPGACTVADAARDIVGADRCVVDPALAFADPNDFDAVIVAIGEDAYAEMRGAIRPWRSLSYAKLKTSYAVDLDILRRLHGRDGRRPKVVTIFFGGRPLYLNEEINLSDAFVAGWLPGPNAKPQIELMFAGVGNEASHDFTGKLSFSWPGRKKAFLLNHRPPHLAAGLASDGDDPMDADVQALFPYGYGLSYAAPRTDMESIPLDEAPPPAPAVPARQGLHMLGGGSQAEDLAWKVCGHNLWSSQTVDLSRPTELLIMQVTPEEGGARVRFKGFDAFIYAQRQDRQPQDFRPYLAADSRLEITLKVIGAPDAPLHLGLHDDFPGQVGLDIAPMLKTAGDEWRTISVTFAELDALGMELDNVDTPFMLYCEGRAELILRDVRIVLGAEAHTAEASVHARQTELAPSV